MVKLLSGLQFFLSGFPQWIVLGPLLFSLYINGISTDIDSEIRLFFCNCICVKLEMQRTH